MSVFPQFRYSSAKVRRVKHMQFGVLSPTEIKAMSVAHITKAETVVNGQAVTGGLEDPRLGTCDYHATCRTCKCTYTGSGMVNDCPGHFGHIELAKPVFHIGFLGVVHNLLRCVCIHCSRVLFDKNDARVKEALRKANPKKRLAALLKLSKKSCDTTEAPDAQDTDMFDTSSAPTQGRDGCGWPQPTYRREGFNLTIEYSDRVDVPDERKRPLLAEEVYNVFKNISDEDCRLLGLNPVFARPDWLICTVVPVPPPHVRPPVALDNMSHAQDDLTYKLADIIKANIGLRNSLNKGEPTTIVTEYEKLLQYHIATFVDNQLPGMPQAKMRGGKKALKTIRQRLVGKGGRVRQNLMGKRVDFSARTVITADPNLSIDRVGVPRSIASNLTIPERVTRYNLQRLQRLVANGPHNHPGAKYIIHEDGNRIDLRFVSNRNDLNLRQGWTVERHLADGDYVLFNRQPSLHKMSIMCHRVKVMDYSTFRLNLTCTSPYNADFDGDEMNLHALQTLPAIAEAKELMVTPRLIVSPQSNKPVMGIVQDTLLGVQKMTKRDVLIEKWKMMNMITWMGDVWDGKIPAPAVMVRRRGSSGSRRRFTPYWTGKQLLSMIIPDVNVTLKSSGAPDPAPPPEALHPNDTRVIIDRGQLLAGIVDKKTLGKSAGGLIHIIMNDATPEHARDFINNVQRVVNYWLRHRGFSIGIADAEADAETMRVISNTIRDAKINVTSLVQKGQMGLLITQPGATMMQSFERMVNTALNNAREQAGNRAAQALDETNAVRAMVSAGSKGSFINIAQIIACVGQQNVEGQRIPYGFVDRSLPHYAKDDLGPQSRGFVENSYLKGLTPQEFFFHMMGGREGLIDTAVKTAETGYIQRRLVKAMEDVSVRYDGTVRNSEGIVIQFLYGEDGMDGRWVEFQRFDSFNLNAAKFRRMFVFDPDAPNFGRLPSRGNRLYMDQTVIDTIRTNVEMRAILDTEIRQLQADRVTLEEVLRSAGLLTKNRAALPVHLHRLIANARKKFKVDDNKPSDLDPAYVIESVQQTLTTLVVVAGEDTLSVEAQENATTLFSILARSVLASKRVIKEFRLSRSAFDWVLGEVHSRFHNAMVNPGEMSGVLAAQSMGEPATQMTLNTFHYAGVSAKNVTLGVPRLKELINIAKKIKTPTLTVYLKPHLSMDEERVRAMRPILEFTTLHDMTRTAEIFYDPDNLAVEADQNWVHDAAEVYKTEDVVLSPWVLRLELHTKKFTFEHIKSCIARQLDETPLQVLNSAEGAELPVMRIRLQYTEAEKAAMDAEEQDGADTEDDMLKHLETSLLSKLKLGGIDDVKKVFFRLEKTRPVWTPESGTKMSQEWVINTDGTNLLEVLSLPDVDPARTTSNDIVEVLSVLGIEATRAALLFELRAVVEFDGAYVNYRHIGTLVDVITARGYLTAITRHGINRVDNGPLQRASFEETCEIYMDAAAFAEDDGLNGVTENLMLGQLCPMGTGTFDLLLDEQMLKGALEFTQNVVQGQGAEDGTSATPMQQQSPDALTPMDTGALTPGGETDAAWSPDGQFTPDPLSPGAISPLSGGYSSPVNDGMQSPNWFPESPGHQASSPGYGGSPSSPGYSPTSPGYSPTSPGYSPTSPGYSPTSPGYSPTSPGYSPTSPGYSPTSPGYSPTSPGYSPTSPGYSPTSPGYSPTSPGYSPTSPGYSPTSPGYSPTSPGYSPTSPGYSPTSPGYSPTSPGYSPTSPGYSPTSPGYSPTSPGYSPTSPGYSPTSPGYSPAGGASPSYSPSSGDPSSLSPSSPSYNTPSYDVNGGAASPSYSPSNSLYSIGGYSASPSTSDAGGQGSGGDANAGRYSPTQQQ